MQSIHDVSSIHDSSSLPHYALVFFCRDEEKMKLTSKKRSSFPPYRAVINLIIVSSINVFRYEMVFVDLFFSQLELSLLEML